MVISQRVLIAYCLLLSADDEENYPLMLTKDWFQPENAGHLRRYLRHFILQLFAEQSSAKESEPVLAAFKEIQEWENALW